MFDYCCRCRAIELDNENGNTLWQDDIAKEMKNVKITFKVLEDGIKVPAGYNFIGCRLIFTVRLTASKERLGWLLGGTC
jgi:hypothetical protein